ncbi:MULTISPECIES: glycosyltransferase family 4 protein [Aminobacterium]|jgi:glycosyltransferase involved in cell wall biosynthesis|uniref:glycosyltransferase family 4 protein n=1 Tax=Aminobacterium TaxID=81466 RepID=UPI00257961FE|nr:MULTISPECIES: glycosyltransferase family 4 protein [unclassified Aminobacterium]
MELKVNILLINHYAGSPAMGMEYRPYYMAKEWLKLGHKVTIVAASFSHLRSQQPYITSSMQEEKIDGIRYVWLKTPSYTGNGLGRVKNMLCFVAKLYKYLPQIANKDRPDVIIASSTYPLDIFPARHIARCFDAKLIFEVHDLWPLSPMEIGNMSPLHPFIWVMQRGEDYACKYADKIVSILPFANKHLATRGMSPKKFVHVPNGINADEWQNNNIELPPEHQTFFKEHQGSFFVGYAGSFGLANALHYLISAAPMLQDKKIVFVLIGQGAEKTNLIRLTKKLKVDNVFFLPTISKIGIPLCLNNFDCLIMTARRSKLCQYGISLNKIFDYMMSGRPIINAIEAGNDPVKEAGCGLSVEAENPEAIAKGIVKIYNMTEEERRHMGEKGKKYVLEHNAYPVLAASFLHAMEER